MSTDSHNRAPEAAPQPPSPNKKKSRKGIVIGVTGGVAGAAIAAGAIMGINLGVEPPKSDPTTEAPAETNEPSPEETWSPEVTVADLEIPAGLETEAVGELIIQRYDEWRNAGTDNDRIESDWRDFSGSTGDFVDGIAAQYAPLYTEALYISDWKARPDLVHDQDFGVRANASTLEMNLVTNDPAYGDLEAFHRNISFDAAREISNAGTSRVIEIDYTESNNADKNRVGEEFGTEYEGNFGRPMGTITMTLATVGGVEKIAAVTVTAR
jgi:hypothetical protein